MFNQLIPRSAPTAKRKYIWPVKQNKTPTHSLSFSLQYEKMLVEKCSELTTVTER